MKNKKYTKRSALFILGLAVFLATGVVRAAPPQIMLTGVMMSQDGVAAYIDGKLLRVGDEIAGCEIISIRHAGMHVKSGKKTYFVPIAKPEGIREVEAPKAETSEAQESAAEPAADDDWKIGVSVAGQLPAADAPEQNSGITLGDTDKIKLITAAILIITGSLVSFVAGIWLLVIAFQESVWWGLGCLLVPFVQLIFVIKFWYLAKAPFLVGLIGTLVIYSSWFVMPGLFEAIQ